MAGNQRRGIRRFEIAAGPERGQRVVEVTTGGGLQFEIRPDRSFDVGRVWFRGTPYVRKPPPGLGAGQGPLPRTYGSFFFTCGFDHIRQPETAPDPITGAPVNYPLHGNLPFTPATIGHLGEDTQGRTPSLICEGEVMQRAADDRRVRLNRRYEAPVGGCSFAFTDTVTNIGARPFPFMAMYHFNRTYPMIGQQTVVEFPGADRQPWPVPSLTADQDHVLHVEAFPMTSDATGRAGVIIRNDGAHQPPPVSITFDTASLPFLQLWRGRAQGVDLLAIEPVTNRRATRAKLQDAGEIRILAPGETVTMAMAITFGD